MTIVRTGYKKWLKGTKGDMPKGISSKGSKYRILCIQRTDTEAVSRIDSVVDVTAVRINVEALTIITRPQISIVTSIAELIVRRVNITIEGNLKNPTKIVKVITISFH